MSSLRRQILAASPRGFASPLSHGDYFTEPLELASGLANATGPGSPGTFGSVRGRLRKARSRSNINDARWVNPGGQGKAARTDRLLRGSLTATLAKAQNIPLAAIPVPKVVRTSARPPKAIPVRSARPAPLRLVAPPHPVPPRPTAPAALHIPDAPPPPPPVWQTLGKGPSAWHPAAPAAPVKSAWSSSPQSFAWWESQHDHPHLATLRPGPHRQAA